MLEELEKEIKKFKLDELLYCLAELSREIFLSNGFFKKVIWDIPLGGFQRKYEQWIPAWVLADLSYAAIKSSNDHRSLMPSSEDICKLANLSAKVSDELAAKSKEEIPSEDLKAHILLGLTQKQFWYQEIIRGGKLYYNFLRYFILLSEIPRNYFQHHIQPNNDLVELSGFDIKSFAQLQMAGFSVLQVSSVIKFTISDELKESYPVLTEENLRSCIGHFTGDYNYYRGASFPNNPLFFKPIVKTSTNKYIISNAFIWARKFYEGIYWLIRDKHMKIQSQAFTNNFGEYYEKYIEEVLGFYLNPGQFERITVGDKKKADWLIHAGRYTLVVEQKSCLMTIALKEEYPSMAQLDKYLNNFKEAYIQIADTVKEIGETDKTIIKLILHFEKFYIGEAIIKDRVSSMCKDCLEDLTNYFFIDTEEFEKLMQVLSDDMAAFNKIIETKIEYEASAQIAEGKEFTHMIDRCAPVTEIRYLEKYNHLFDGLFKEA